VELVEVMEVEVDLVDIELLFQVEQNYFYNQDQMQLQLEQVEPVLLQVLKETLVMIPLSVISLQQEVVEEEDQVVDQVYLVDQVEVVYTVQEALLLALLVIQVEQVILQL